MRLALLVFALLILTLEAFGAIITAASANLSDVQAAVAAASRGDTVTVPAGSATWSGSLSLTKGINLQGAGQANTIITAGGANHLIDIVPDLTVIANNETIRVEGFTFDGGGASQMFIDVECVGTTQAKAFKNLVIGKNLLRNSSTAANPFATVLCHGQIRGCVYSNTFDRCDFPFRSLGLDAQNDLNFYPIAFGSADSLFFEGNTVQFSSSFSGPDAGVTQTGWGGRLVFRYNTWNMANATTQYTTHDVHGYQNFGGGWNSGQSGTEISEYYGNTYTNISGGGEMMSYRGGWMLEFNNIWSGGPGAIHVNQFDVCPFCSGGTINGQQGCTVYVPGAAAAGVTTECTNAYFFNNQVQGAEQAATLGTIGAGCSIAENKSFWNFNSSFNGTTGIGRGTTPPVGSPSFGVAYWVASTATETTLPSVIQAGTLYRCLNSGTWTAAYTPYTFPHPLTGVVPASFSVTPQNFYYGVLVTNTFSTNNYTLTYLGPGTCSGTCTVASPFFVNGSNTWALTSNQTQVVSIYFAPSNSAAFVTNTAAFTGSGVATLNVPLSAGSYIIQSALTFNGDAGTIRPPYFTDPAHRVLQASNINYTIPEGGVAVYGFNIINSGSYVVTNTCAPTNSTFSSVWWNIDGMPTNGPNDKDLVWSVAPGGTNTLGMGWQDGGNFQSNGVPLVSWNLSSGNHALYLVGRSTNFAVSQLQVTTVQTNQPVPTANFSAGPTSGVAPLLVTFTNLSANANAFAWTFGDGSYSFLSNNVSHTYANASTNTVVLQAIGPGGSASLTNVGYVVVTNPVVLPTALFTAAPTSGSAPLTVYFTNQSSNAVSYLWDLGLGPTLSSATNPVQTYQAATYTIALIAYSASGASNAFTNANYIVVTNLHAAVANFTGTPTNGASPLQVTFTNLSTGATNAIWQFGDGIATTMNFPFAPVHAYTTGTYTVSMIAQGAGGTNLLSLTNYIVVTNGTQPAVVLLVPWFVRAFTQ